MMVMDRGRKEGPLPVLRMSATDDYGSTESTKANEDFSEISHKRNIKTSLKEFLKSDGKVGAKVVRTGSVSRVIGPAYATAIKTESGVSKLEKIRLNWTVANNDEGSAQVHHVLDLEEDVTSDPVGEKSSLKGTLRSYLLRSSKEVSGTEEDILKMIRQVDSLLPCQGELNSDRVNDAESGDEDKQRYEGVIHSSRCVGFVDPEDVLLKFPRSEHGGRLQCPPCSALSRCLSAKSKASKSQTRRGHKRKCKSKRHVVDYQRVYLEQDSQGLLNIQFGEDDEEVEESKPLDLNVEEDGNYHKRTRHVRSRSDAHQANSSDEDIHLDDGLTFDLRGQQHMYDEDFFSRKGDRPVDEDDKGFYLRCLICQDPQDSREEHNQHLREMHDLIKVKGRLTCARCKKRYKRFNGRGSRKPCPLHCQCSASSTRLYAGALSVDDDDDLVPEDSEGPIKKKFNLDYSMVDDKVFGSYSKWVSKIKVCFECPFEYRSISEFVVHMEVAHGNQTLKELALQVGSKDVRDFDWFGKSSAKRTAESASDKKPPFVKKGSFKGVDRPCEFCPKSFRNLGFLKAHIEEAHGDKDISTLENGGILLYMNLMKKLPPEFTTCEICGKSVAKHFLNHHKSLHGKKRTKRCPICELDINVNSWNSHKNKHSKEEHLCTYCGLKFRSRDMLRNHVVIHDKERKKFQCAECGKVFSWHKGLLEHHRKAHTMAKPQPCPVCNKVVSSLSRHMTVHVEKKKFSCSICGQEGRRRDTIRTHIKGQHAGIGEILAKGNPDETEETPPTQSNTMSDTHPSSPASVQGEASESISPYHL